MMSLRFTNPSWYVSPTYQEGNSEEKVRFPYIQKAFQKSVIENHQKFRPYTYKNKRVWYILKNVQKIYKFF